MISEQSKITNSTNQRPWYREPMVWMVIMIPLTSVLVGMGMLTMAIRSYDGLVVDDYYKRGKEINRVLKRTHTSEEYNISAILNLSIKNQAVVTLSHNSEFIAPDKIRFNLFHRTRAGFDQTVSLQRYADGLYRGDFDTPESGIWLAQVETEQWRIGGQLSLPDMRLTVLQAK